MSCSPMASTPLTAHCAFLLRSSHRRLSFTIACSSPTSPPPPPAETTHRISRRFSVSIAALFLAAVPTRAAVAGSPFDKYVKRKKLDPLEAYVPAVLLTQEQFKDLEKSLESEQPEYDVSRSLLRSGPAGSLRINMRAVAQYASDDGKGKQASDAVDQCLRALEDLDSLLLHASRKDPNASIESMKSKINTALVALDSLLQTVPSAVLDKGRSIAAAYGIPTNQNQETKSEDLDPDLKQLEALL